MSELDSLYFAICVAVYLGMVIYLGYRGYRNTGNRNDYLVAGRSAHPFVMAMSYGAAFISTSAIVGFGGIAGTFGMGIMWLTFMNIAVGILIAFAVFGHRTREIGQLYNAHTFPEFIGKRFGSRGLRVLCALVIFLFMPLYSSVVLIGGARFLQEMLSIHYNWALLIFAAVVALYVTFGGMKGVMYVDAMMGSIMIVGMLTLLVMSYWKLGGVFSAHRELSNMAPLVAERLPEMAKAGHAGWTAMPRFHSEWWWTLVSSIMLGVGIGALAQPQLAVRFMTVKSSRELYRATLIGAVFILLVVGSAYMVGALSNVFFYYGDKGLLGGAHSGKLAIEAANGNKDLIIPLFINRALPKFILYAFSLTLLSAAMSTLSSLFHVIGGTIGNDLFHGLGRGSRGSVLATRCGVVAGIVISIVLGFVLPPGFIARGTAIFFGVCAAAFLPAYVAALYWEKTSRFGVYASMATGIGISLFGLFFLHRSESAPLGICKALFGRTELIGAFPWPFVDMMIYSLPVSAVALVLGSLLVKNKSKGKIR